FWGMARRFAVKDAALTDSIREGQRKIFSEDVHILERQQDNLSHYPDRRLLLLNIDAGGARARQMITKAIAAEGPVAHQRAAQPELAAGG
ncbi:MAG TPA: aromatic ring-hydroxylating dioxygenase subunit alpha, partial [Sphingomonas sp.]|nr:aromatic ring-hydroxylating dioxygenase subunit alpha [Sphingomonas sp.]